MGFKQTFASASSNVGTTFKGLDWALTNRSVHVAATTTDATGSEVATIRFVLVDKEIADANGVRGKVIALIDVVATSGSVGTDIDGGSPDFVMTMSTPVVDLAGATAGASGRKWFVGIPALVPSDITIYLSPARMPL